MSEEKINELKEKEASLQEELKELTPEELEQVCGGGVKYVVIGHSHRLQYFGGDE